ncbi:MAG TPA: PLP-dependent transferase [Brachybacterium massiliense]|uniref:homocysteine desulfhydrase n=1 Tax=Brachybacterium massiliense TaxID=1755098 RepID=A0A921SXL7_9MICO|nr:PLP-dependent transferase [Brachybacterium massiliense]
MTFPDTHTPELSLRPDTVTVQAGRPARTPGAPVNTPITLSAKYIHDSDRPYGRDGNEGWDALETALGALEGGHAISFASGMAAIAAVAELVPVGGVVVLPTTAYHGVSHWFGRLAERGLVTVRTADPSDTAAVLEAADGADLVWLESIANPTMEVADIPAIAAGAREKGALTAVDATFATPLRQRPLELGADLVVHSATKFLGGHSDLLLGVVIAATQEHARSIAGYRHDAGSIPGGIEPFLALRGLRTLAVRLDRAEANALELARRLSQHPSVAAVHYPGLPGDSEHERARAVLPDGSGAMVSFETIGTAEQTERVLAGLHLFAHATSLGDVESSIERRARWAGDAASGVPATLCRMSVGIENVEDLWTDLDEGLRGLSGAPGA